MVLSRNLVKLLLRSPITLIRLNCSKFQKNTIDTRWLTPNAEHNLPSYSTPQTSPSNLCKKNPPLKTQCSRNLLFSQWNDYSINLRRRCVVLKSFSRSFSTQKPDQPEAELSMRERMKKGFKDYGAALVVVHIILSITSFGISYVLVSNGLDVRALLEKVGMGYLMETKMAEGSGTIIIAYAFYEALTPIRAAITLAITPTIVKYLRRKGILKIPPKV